MAKATNSNGLTISKRTPVTLGLVVLLGIGLVWLATDRARAWASLDDHEKRMVQVETDIRYLTHGMVRVETELGTLPDDPSELP